MSPFLETSERQLVFVHLVGAFGPQWQDQVAGSGVGVPDPDLGAVGEARARTRPARPAARAPPATGRPSFCTSSATGRAARSGSTSRACTIMLCTAGVFWTAFSRYPWVLVLSGQRPRRRVAVGQQPVTVPRIPPGAGDHPGAVDRAKGPVNTRWRISSSSASVASPAAIKRSSSLRTLAATEARRARRSRRLLQELLPHVEDHRVRSRNPTAQPPRRSAQRRPARRGTRRAPPRPAAARLPWTSTTSPTWPRAYRGSLV